ncbi:hypothetical protein [Metabacillus indicus]|uniref:Uncharacterized protein n=1 Tax=Metabacillus indicus TaxID=246786 RepID=A0A084H185_METID|nr:hypothetical protein [Metabacillus indicus]KEZ53347.1 hypothetical protein GS18_0207035 [Metabacillus indicus]
MLLNCYLKEMKDCFRDSRTLILTVLLPIILMTGLTLFYERMVSDGGAIPVLNLFTILKELLFGIVEYDHILLVLGSNLAVIVIALIIGRILFLKDKWVMN